MITPCPGLCIEGDPDYVREHSIDEAKHATAMLRFLSPESQLPEACSYMTPVDLLPAPSYDVWLQKPGESSPTKHLSGIPLPPPEPLKLDKDTVPKLRTHFALDSLSHLARGVDLSPFEKSLEEALLLFSKATATPSPAEKLVFALVALESILLRNPTEPIQQTVGDRFGFLLAKVAGERQELSKLFKSCYNLRSSFVHHGCNPSDLELLRRFLAMAWVLLMQLLKNHRAFRSKDHLLDYLDSLKYA
jgi:hypothetical protein